MKILVEDLYEKLGRKYFMFMVPCIADIYIYIYISITVQRHATQSSLFIILQVHSTCFGCQTHPSSGVHKTVTTASDTVRLPPFDVAKLGHFAGR